MTEAEAKTKWCPFARVLWDAARSTPTAVNRADEGLPRGSDCIGSACMAWRFSQRKLEPVQGYTTPEGQTITTRWTEITQQQGDGYCGLAGKSP